MISQDEIDAIKHGVELVSFMKARGIELQQVGGKYRGFCPLHEDTTPSLYGQSQGKPVELLSQRRGGKSRSLTLVNEKFTGLFGVTADWHCGTIPATAFHAVASCTYRPGN
jgi:hypothetical protein